MNSFIQGTGRELSAEVTPQATKVRESLPNNNINARESESHSGAHRYSIFSNPSPNIFNSDDVIQFDYGGRRSYPSKRFDDDMVKKVISHPAHKRASSKNNLIESTEQGEMIKNINSTKTSRNNSTESIEKPSVEINPSTETLRTP